LKPKFNRPIELEDSSKLTQEFSSVDPKQLIDVYDHILPNGKKYSGQAIEKHVGGEVMLHGHGTLISNDGQLYDGDFRNGKMEGRGTLQNKDLSMYKGEFMKGLPNGYGRFTEPTGYSYEG